MAMQPIFLITDFGHSDAYVATMKSVIYSINSSLKIIDITHDIEPQNIEQANFILATIADYLPKQSTLIGVVDPGVGSRREAVVIETLDGKYFVGPNNGLFTTLTYKFGISRVWELSQSPYNLQPVSSTFHGRDIFAPNGAKIAEGIGLDYLQAATFPKESLVLNKIQLPSKPGDVRVIHIDRFGNLILNIKDLEIFEDTNSPSIPFMGRNIPYVSSFSDVNENELGLLKGSSGFLEIFCRNGNAADVLKLIQH